jgi:Uma2 family endonuclease
MSKEQLFTHNQVKGQFAIVLGGLAKERAFGMFFGDGLHLVNEEAGISGQPDGTFVSAESLATGQAQFVEGAHEGYLELLGSPDMVLEVVSASSVHKDKVVLREAYWQAGIKEYWLVDARRTPLHFDIFRHAPKGYVSGRGQAGWIKSTVFGKSFRLTQQSGAGGFPEYTLAVR